MEAIRIDREALDVRSSGDQRKRVDAYFVLYRCERDSVNPRDDWHDWICRFEVKRGEQFAMRNFNSKSEALKARGF